MIRTRNARGRFAVLAAVVALASCAVHAVSALTLPGTEAQRLPVGLELYSYAIPLLVAAAGMYVAALLGRDPRLGRCASTVATAALCQLTLSLAVSLIQSGGIDRVVQGGFVIVVLALLCYLLIERHYSDRRAGGFVLSVITAAALAELWVATMDAGAGNSTFLRVLQSVAISVAAATGYALLASGAWLAVRSLLRERARHVVGMAMIGSNGAGLSLLALAAIGWEASMQHAPRVQWFVNPIEPWALLVVIAYAGHFVLLHMLRPGLRDTARWVAILFAGSAVGLVMTLGIRMGAFA